MWQHKPQPSPRCSKLGLQMLRLALIPDEGSREEASSWGHSGGQEEGLASPG